MDRILLTFFRLTWLWFSHDTLLRSVYQISLRSLYETGAISGDGRPTEQRFVDEGQLRSQDLPTVARAHGAIRGRSTSAALGRVVGPHHQSHLHLLLVVRWHY